MKSNFSRRQKSELDVTTGKVPEDHQRYTLDFTP